MLGSARRRKTRVSLAHRAETSHRLRTLRMSTFRPSRSIINTNGNGNRLAFRFCCLSEKKAAREFPLLYQRRMCIKLRTSAPTVSYFPSICRFFTSHFFMLFFFHFVASVFFCLSVTRKRRRGSTTIGSSVRYCGADRYLMDEACRKRYL